MGKNRSINCLNCRATLSTTVKHGVTIDVCGECGGVWLEPGELERLTESDPHVGADTHHTHEDHDHEAESERELEDELGNLLDRIVDAVIGDDGDTSENGSDRPAESCEDVERQPVRTSISRNTSYLSGPVAERYQTAERDPRLRAGGEQSDAEVNWELVQTLLQAHDDEGERIGRRRLGSDVGSASVTIRFKDDSHFDWSLERALEDGTLSHLDVEPEQFREAIDEISEWADRDPENAAALVLKPEQALAEALGPEADWVSDVGPHRSMSEPEPSGRIASLRVEMESTSLEGN